MLFVVRQNLILQKLPKHNYYLMDNCYFCCSAPTSQNIMFQLSVWALYVCCSQCYCFSIISSLYKTWCICFYSRTSKAFSNKQTVKQCGCSEVYLDCLQTFLPALSCPLQKEVLRSGVRTFLHRMIICLEEEVLPFIPSASEHMLKDCEAKDLQEFIPLINQITAKFKV